MYRTSWGAVWGCRLWNCSVALTSTSLNEKPITVAALSKAWTVFARSNTEIVCSNSTQGMDVCVRLLSVCVVLCIGRGLATRHEQSSPARTLKSWFRTSDSVIVICSYDLQAVSKSKPRRWSPLHVTVYYLTSIVAIFTGYSALLASWNLDATSVRKPMKTCRNLLRKTPGKHPLARHLSVALQPFVGPWPLFSFLILYTVGRTPWTGDHPVTRPLPTHGTTQTHNKHTQTSMPRLGLEPTTPAFERAKTVHALDRAGTVVGLQCLEGDNAKT
jgi:hypothetical protein